jgi:flagellar protein FlgJ
MRQRRRDDDIPKIHADNTRVGPAPSTKRERPDNETVARYNYEKRYLGDNPQAFTDSIRNQTKRIAVAKGLPNADVLADLASATAANETLYGEKIKNNNLFGVKGSEGIPVTTHEYEKGKKVKRVEKFRGYDTSDASIADYLDQMTKNPKFKPVGTAPTLDSAFKALPNIPYATDPDYAKKLKRINERSKARDLPTTRPKRK